MKRAWKASEMWPNVYYFGPRSPGNLEHTKGTWVWTLYPNAEKPGLVADFGTDLETAKRCVEAMIRLEG